MIKEENHAENNQGYDYRRYFKNGWGNGRRSGSRRHAQMETIEEAALVHGIEPDLLVARVNAFVESKQA